LLAAGCKVRDPPPITAPWQDSFDRDSPGESWYASGDGYGIVDGMLSAHGAHNHPLWLRAKIPRDVRIEFDCWSTEQRGDIKVEVFGDGHSYDPDGGLNEHGKDLVERKDPKVVPKQHYHWRIERAGKTMRWLIDGKPFLEYDDPHPLEGPGHEYFAFNNWETDTWFDNLSISPL
jgi:hypothetical protein